MIFPAGSTNGSTQCINITTIDDEVLEGNETFTVYLAVNSSSVMLGNNEATVTILDNDCK